MAATYLLTYSDVIEHSRMWLALRSIEPKNAADHQSAIRRAIKGAYNEVAGRRTWTYLRRHDRLQLVAPYSTGTVVFDYTGGAYERMVTLTTGTWPTWAANGQIRFNDTVCAVATRESNSVITLDSRLNPGADVASTTYTLYRNIYNLPADFIKMADPVPADNWYGAKMIGIDEWMAFDRHSYSAGTPVYYALGRDPNFIGALAVYLWPVPSAAATWDYIYIARPRDLIHAGYTEADCKGEVTTAADSTSVTGYGTAFASSMEGSIIRFSGNSRDLPTAMDGHNPRIDERTITAVGSATGITVDQGVSNTLTKVKYAISDPVDLEAGLIDVFLRCVERNLGRYFNVEDKKGLLQMEYEQAMILACEQDSRYIGIRVAGGSMAVGEIVSIGEDE